MGVSKFERFFRAVASVDVDKADLKRFDDFIDEKIYDLLLIGQVAAKANLRDIIEPWDLPITKGLQESIHLFRDLEEAIDLEPILEHLVARPLLDLSLSEETEARLPNIAGGISVALGRTFKIIDPDLKNPGPEEWQKAFRIFNQLL